MPDNPSWAEDNPTADTVIGPLPVPCTWVVGGHPDGDAVCWERYLSATKYDERRRDLDDTTDPDAVAWLTIDPYEIGSGFDAELGTEYTFEIDGEEVFCVRDADHDDVYATIIDALRAVDFGDDVGELDMVPESGTEYVSEEERELEDIEERREKNAGLGDFA